MTEEGRALLGMTEEGGALLRTCLRAQALGEAFADRGEELGHWLYPIMDPGTMGWGYVNYRGEWVIKPTLEDAKLFTYVWNDRVAPAKMDGKWGCVDHTGQFVVKNQYNTSAEAAMAGRRWAEGKKF